MEEVSICHPHKHQESMGRLRAYQNKPYMDRVPIGFAMKARYLIIQRGIGFVEYFASPEINFYRPIINFRWRMESMEDDF